MSGVLVVAELRRGQVRDVSFELVGAALELRAQGAGDVRVAVVGPADDLVVQELAKEGVSEIVRVDAARERADTWVLEQALEVLLDEIEPTVVLVGHTTDGQGFAPAVAARRQLGFAANVSSVRWEGDQLTAERGVYGDRLVATLVFERPTSLVMLRPASYAAATERAAGVPVRELAVQASGDSPLTHLEFVEPEPADVDITKAPFLLAIGRGVEDESDIERLEQVAEAVGATLSASRPLVDAGWIPSSRQVGQSGKTVKPSVYLALGISGAVQHLAGIRDAGTIIAVNVDPRAPIFQVADYGAVADLFEVAEALPQHFQ